MIFQQKNYKFCNIDLRFFFRTCDVIGLSKVLLTKNFLLIQQANDLRKNIRNDIDTGNNDAETKVKFNVFRF